MKKTNKEDEMKNRKIKYFLLSKKKNYEKRI